VEDYLSIMRKLVFAFLCCVLFSGCFGFGLSFRGRGKASTDGAEGSSSLGRISESEESLFRSFSASEGRIAVSSKGRVFVGRVGASNLFSGQPLVDFGEQPFDAFFDSKFSRLALGFSNRVIVISLSNPGSPWALTGLGGRIGALSFSPDGNSVLFSRMDNRIYRWRFLVSGALSRAWSEEKFEQYIGHGAVVSALAFHSFGRVFFSGDWNGDLFVWQTYDADEFGGDYDKNIFYSKFYTSLAPRLVRPRSVNDSIERLAVSSDGQWLAVGLASGKVEVWMIRGLKLISYGILHVGGVLGLEFLPDSQHLVSLGRDGRVVKWQIVDVGKVKSSNEYSGVRLDLVPIGEYNDTEIQTISVETVRKGDPHIVAGLSSGDVHNVVFKPMAELARVVHEP
jgi:WD40 repeat protein